MAEEMATSSAVHIGIGKLTVTSGICTNSRFVLLYLTWYTHPGKYCQEILTAARNFTSDSPAKSFNKSSPPKTIISKHVCHRV